MKKVLFIFIFIFSCVSVYAATAPKWSEFCPKEYLNCEILPIEALEMQVKKQPIFKRMKYRESLYYKNIMCGYWAERKKQFENELSSCDGLSADAKGMCYLKIREMEYKKVTDEQEQNILRGIQKQLFLQRY